MAHAQPGTVLRHLRRLVGAPAVADLSDRQLLERFARGREEEAFEALVRRHGPLVLGACRRVLRHEHDAEDAFQATFLVLARKAGSVRWHESVSHWLHAVAYRVAVKARADLRRRRRHEQRAGADVRPPAAADAGWRELCSLLDEEIQRLPGKLRAPLLLCCLEGLSRDEAAARLGWSLGTVKGRLERGREALRARLARRGLALSAALLPALVGQGAGRAAVSPSVLATAVRAAAQFRAGPAAGVISDRVRTLVEGVLQAMFWTKLKSAAALVLAVSLLVGGAGVTGYRALAGRPVEAAEAEPAPASVEAGPAIPQADVEEPDKDAERKDKDGDKRNRDKKDGDRGERAEVNAVVKAVDDKGTLTATFFRDGERPADKTFEVAKEAPVTIGGKEAKLADLKAGMRVTLTLSKDRATVTAIKAAGPKLGGEARKFGGEVKEIDFGKNTITVAAEGGARTFAVAKNSAILVGGIEARLSDLDPNMRVTLELDADQKEAVSIQAKGSPDDVYGVVQAVDPAKLRLTLRKTEAQPFETTYGVAKGATVLIAGKEATLADLGPGMRVCLRLAGEKAVAAVRAAAIKRDGDRGREGGRRDREGDRE